MAVNLGGDPVTLALNAPVGRILLASEPAEGQDGALTLHPESSAIVQVG